MKNRTLHRKISSLAVILAIMVYTLSACAGKNSPAKEADSTAAGTGEAPDTKSSDTDLSSVTLRFGSTGWELQKELLKAAGLDHMPYQVEYIVFQGGNLCLEAMAANQIDLTGTSEIPPDSDIKSVADLKGKRVGYIKSTTAQYFLYVMLKNAGLSWSDIDAVEITTADGVTALLGGELDAFASYGNSINAAKNGGAVTLESAENILSGNYPYEASDTALEDKAKRAAIIDYLARLQLANEWQKNNMEKWAKISADPTGQTYEDALEVMKKGYEQRDTKVIPITDEVIASEQSVADAFYAVGLLEQKTEVNTLYDASLTDAYNAALASLRK